MPFRPNCHKFTQPDGPSDKQFSASRRDGVGETLFSILSDLYSFEDIDRSDELWTVPQSLEVRTHGGVRFVRAGRYQGSGARGEHKISSSLCKSNEHLNSPNAHARPRPNPFRISRLVSPATTSALASQGPSVLRSPTELLFQGEAGQCIGEGPLVHGAANLLWTCS